MTKRAQDMNSDSRSPDSKAALPTAGGGVLCLPKHPCLLSPDELPSPLQNESEKRGDPGPGADRSGLSLSAVWNLGLKRSSRGPRLPSAALISPPRPPAEEGRATKEGALNGLARARASLLC